jgi:hypothetical protein
MSFDIQVRTDRQTLLVIKVFYGNLVVLGERNFEANGGKHNKYWSHVSYN